MSEVIIEQADSHFLTATTEQIRHLRALAPLNPELSVGEVSGDELHDLLDQILLVSGDEETVNEWRANYNKRWDRYSASFEESVSGEFTFSAERSGLSPEQERFSDAYTALQLAVEMHTKNFPEARSRIAVAGGYLMDNGALNEIYNGGFIVQPRSSELSGDQDDTDRLATIKETFKFQGSMLGAAALLYSWETPDAELDVIKAFRNLVELSVYIVDKYPDSASDIYQATKEVEEMLKDVKMDGPTISYFAVPLREHLVSKYRKKSPQGVRTATINALADLLERTPDNPDYLAIRDEIVKRNKRTNWLVRDWVDKFPKENEAEKQALQRLGCVSVFDTHTLVNTMVNIGDMQSTKSKYPHPEM